MKSVQWLGWTHSRNKATLHKHVWSRPANDSLRSSSGAIDLKHALCQGHVLKCRMTSTCFYFLWLGWRSAQFVRGSHQKISMFNCVDIHSRLSIALCDQVCVLSCKCKCGQSTQSTSLFLACSPCVCACVCFCVCQCGFLELLVVVPTARDYYPWCWHHEAVRSQVRSCWKHLQVDKTYRLRRLLLFFRSLRSSTVWCCHISCSCSTCVSSRMNLRTFEKCCSWRSSTELDGNEVVVVLVTCSSESMIVKPVCAACPHHAGDWA